MNTYERESIGNIIIIKNMIFRNNISGKKELDHSWMSGRPCVIIHSDNEYEYFLTMKSKPDYKKYGYKYVPINKSSLLNMVINRYNKQNNTKSRQKEITGAVNLENIYRIAISGHDEIGKITFQSYKYIIERLKNYYKADDLNKIIEKAETIRGR